MANIDVCHEDMTGKRRENVVGMSIHPFQWNFYVLVGKYLHYLIFDDVIMLHH